MASLATAQASKLYRSVYSREGEMRLDRKGVPLFAQPWIQLGKVQERHKWHYFTLNRTEVAIVSELQGLKKGIMESVPRQIQDSISNKLDASNARISLLIKDYKKLMCNETESVPTTTGLVSLSIPSPKEKETTPTSAPTIVSKATQKYDIAESAAAATGEPTAPSEAARETTSEKSTPTPGRTDSKAASLATEGTPKQPPTPTAQPSFRYPFFGQPTDRRQPPIRRAPFSRPTFQ